ncbi:hypothetical protein VitviT2T_006189 [Vitis vinifera]|uniref:Importin-9 n=1 Tax=Vitis vinifera TaxID=29760 RepID=A0ABY9BW00_VITVI|nr:hypothetical protein VitviT2T_006189 [Vitis vinifera]
MVQNDYLPPEWLPLLQVVVGGIGDEDEENSVLFQLLSTVVEAGNENVAVHLPHIISLLVGQISKSIPPNPEPWPQMVERGFAALAVMGQSWGESMPEEVELSESRETWLSVQATLAKAFSSLLQQAWITAVQPMEGAISDLEASPSCIDDSSALLRSIMRSITTYNELLELKVAELLVAWADSIANWHAWEEMEDLSIFECIKEVVNLHGKFGLKDFIVRGLPSPPVPPVPQRSIIKGIVYSSEVESVKQSLVIAFSEAASSRFKAICSKPCSMWKPLLLTISSGYLCYPDIVERVLEKKEHTGFTNWASALGFIATSTFEHGPSAESEIKLTVMALAKVIERLLGQGNQDSDLLRDCFTSLMEASMQLKELQEEDDNEEAEDDEDAGDDDTDDDDDDNDDDEDSEDGEYEETEEQFLDRSFKMEQVLFILKSFKFVQLSGAIAVDGGLEEIDQKSIVLSLIQRYHQVLIRVQSLPPPIVSTFLNSFPEYSSFFQQHG